MERQEVAEGDRFLATAEAVYETSEHRIHKNIYIPSFVTVSLSHEDSDCMSDRTAVYTSEIISVANICITWITIQT